MKKLGSVCLSWPVVSAMWGAIIGGLMVYYVGRWGMVSALILAALLGLGVECQCVRKSNPSFSGESVEGLAKKC